MKAATIEKKITAMNARLSALEEKANDYTGACTIRDMDALARIEDKIMKADEALEAFLATLTNDQLNSSEAFCDLCRDTADAEHYGDRIITARAALKSAGVQS